MIHSIEAKLGAKAAEEVKSLLKEIETYTETSKKNLKDAFFANEAAISNQPSEIRRLSNLEESKLRSDKFSTSIQGDKFSSKTKDKVKAQHLDFKNEASISDLYKYSQFGFNSQMIDPLSLNIPSSNLLLPGSSNFQFQQAESIIDIKQAAQREKPSVVSFLNCTLSHQKKNEYSKNEGNQFYGSDNKLKVVKKGEIEKWVEPKSRNSITLSPSSSMHRSKVR